ADGFFAIFWTVGAGIDFFKGGVAGMEAGFFTGWVTGAADGFFAACTGTTFGGGSCTVGASGLLPSTNECRQLLHCNSVPPQRSGNWKLAPQAGQVALIMAVRLRKAP